MKAKFSPSTRLCGRAWFATWDGGLAYSEARKRGRGGIGRRAALRSLWDNSRGSSSLLDRTILFLFIKASITRA